MRPLPITIGNKKYQTRPIWSDAELLQIQNPEAEPSNQVKVIAQPGELASQNILLHGQDKEQKAMRLAVWPEELARLQACPKIVLKNGSNELNSRTRCSSTPMNQARATVRVHCSVHVGISLYSKLARPT